MMPSINVFSPDEQAMYKLRRLYKSYGYTRYKVSKFEEYDLYAKNKSFLVSENLLTFTDTNGKLMALKPDVTLSIIKNCVANVQTSYKIYYNEHVYRTTNGSAGFREIMQTGLESIGNIDAYAQSEVVILAMKSLEQISPNFLLAISHMRLLEGVLECLGIEGAKMQTILELMESKNLPELRLLCRSFESSKKAEETLCALASMYLPLEAALRELSPIVEECRCEKTLTAYEELSGVYGAAKECALEEKLYVDFSIVNDMNYYDGIIFSGFIDGIPDGILSGGRYDRLMERIGKKTGALGFAVYLDKLERLESKSDEDDACMVLTYNSSADTAEVFRRAEEYRKEGKSVKVVNASHTAEKSRELTAQSMDESENSERKGERA